MLYCEWQYRILLRHRDDPQLLHQTQLVENLPEFDRLAILEVINGDASNGHFLASRRDAHQFTGVSTVRRPTGNELVALPPAPQLPTLLEPGPLHPHPEPRQFVQNMPAPHGPI